MFSKQNREFLTFLVFLFISATFWLMITLNDTIECEVTLPIRIVHVPSNIVLADYSDSVRVTVRDKGFNLLFLMDQNEDDAVIIDFNRYATESVHGHGTVPQVELVRQVKQLFSSQSKIVSVKTEKFDFYYNRGMSRKFPVRLAGNIDARPGYYVYRQILSPDSVVVFANEEALDTLRYVETLPVSLTDIAEKRELTVGLRSIRGAKIATQQVRVVLMSDMLTDASIDVPITSTNVPDGCVLRLFPSKANVKFKAGISRVKSLTAKNFTVVADYSTVSPESSVCHLRLINTPQGITDVQLMTESVDYIIERE